MPLISAIFLAAVLGAVFGIALERQRFWPWPLVDEVTEVAQSVADFGAIIPSGRRVQAPRQASRVRFTVHDPSKLNGGYYAFAGWDAAAQQYAAWLYDSAGTLIHTWPLAYGALDPEHVLGDDDSPHGMVFLRDGSVVVNFDGGRAIGRFNACGEPVWKKRGVYHHLLSVADDGNLWSWRGDDASAYGHYQYLEKINVDTGAKIREIGLIEDVLRSDPEASILLGLQADQQFRKLEKEPEQRWSFDIFHPNDVEELSSALAPQFPMFAAGDLLVSIRGMNLVAVLDRDDHRIKWWSHGPWIGQHDPDFTEDGLISVYNNNTARGPSEIVRIDPQTRAITRLPTAAGASFKSKFMGLHQYLPNGNVLIVVPGEGRVIERSATGELVMEFNNLPAEGSAFNDHVENGIWLSGDFFETLPSCASESP